MAQPRHRIAFVEARYHSFYGAQRSLYTLVTNLPSDRVEPVVLVPGEGIVAREYRNAGVDVDVLPLRGDANTFGGKVLRLSILGKMAVGAELLKYNLRLARWLRQNNIDIVYANDLRALFYVGLACAITRIPLLWYVRVDGHPSIRSRIGLPVADKVILIADGVRNVFTDRDYERHREKFTVLHTGFPVNETSTSGDARVRIRAQLGISPQAEVLGIVASITSRKGRDLLIEALARLRSRGKDVHLMVVGSTPPGHEDYRVKLQERIDELALSPFVHWIGYQRNVLEFYESMDVLVLPSRSEGLPRTVVEGLAAGLPVVATDVGGVKEVITSDMLGRVVPRDDVDALTNALTTVLDSSDRASEELRCGRKEYVRQRFSINSYVKGFLSILETLEK